MSIAAIIPVQDITLANADLAAQGYGPSNFTVPTFAGPRPSHAALHAWTDTDFAEAVKAIPNVQWSETTGEPRDRVAAILSLTGTEWGGNAPPLEGQVTPGLYRDPNDPDDPEGALWWVIQAFDRSVFTQPLPNLPSIVRPARTPGTARPWVQPLDQFDAYQLMDPFTREGELALHNGKTWRVTQADGAGNNIWEPGAFGWQEI